MIPELCEVFPIFVCPCSCGVDCVPYHSGNVSIPTQKKEWTAHAFFPLRSTRFFTIVLIWILVLKPYPGQYSLEFQICCWIVEILSNYLWKKLSFERFVYSQLWLLALATALMGAENVADYIKAFGKNWQM